MSKAILVAGLGFGDEGKGSIVQYLAETEKATAVVRYNGGAQAAHNVVQPDGRHHTFAQFGSATLEGVSTHLSRFMIVEPHALLSEGRHIIQLGYPDPYPLLTIDREALMTTPYHWFANRLRELARGGKRHGSCGVGVGETMQDFLAHGADLAPTIGDLEDPTKLKRKLSFIQEVKVDEFRREIWNNISGERYMKRLTDPVDTVVESYQGMTDILKLVDRDHLTSIMNGHTVVFEGAQGVLLDQDFGFQPHTTWTDITFNNARTLLKETDLHGIVKTVGVIRTYMTRHGLGPLPTELPEATYNAAKFDRHNGTGLWQGTQRIGNFDAALVKYSLDVVGGVDEIALTHLDQTHEFDFLSGRYNTDDPSCEDFIDGSGFLKVKTPVDLKYQESLALALSDGRLKPNHVDMWPSKEEFIERAAGRLRTPIGILSDSPTFRGKWRP